MMYTREDFVVECIKDEQILQMKNEVLLNKYDCKYILLGFEEHNQVRLLFISASKQIRAVEIMEYMLSEFGLVKGDASRASGCISYAILKSQMADMETTDLTEYFEEIINKYIENTVCIVANEFVAESDYYIESFQLYSKRKVKWAVVKSTDIVEKGEQFVMKTLENESGEIIIADENVYVMIGCRGEIYQISSEKFDKTYECTDEKLNIFEEMLDFIPVVQRIITDEYISVDDKAKMCYPKGNTRVYAYRLPHRAKIFPGDGTGDYFLGRMGDYMVIRADDIHDIYIIQREIFEYTYERVEENNL